MNRLVTVFAISLVLQASPAHAAIFGGGSGSGSGGAAGSVIWAGVQFGTPPSSSSSSDGNGCTWTALNPRDANLGYGGIVEREVDGVRYRLYVRRCGGSETLVWVAQTSTRELGRQAASTIYGRLPAPSPGLAPSADRGVVNVGTWFWTSSESWAPQSVTAWVPTPEGVLWARTTARPVRLGFEPGDSIFGSGRVECAGPGRRWSPADGDAGVSSCMYTYRHDSMLHPQGRFPAALSIVWEISWVSNDGTSGRLPSHTTSTDIAVAVDEIQALVSQ
jgi:hypothetical protein